MSCKTVVKVSAPRGFSAYELAVSQGYKGTLQDWLLTLSSERGEKWDGLFVPFAVSVIKSYPQGSDIRVHAYQTLVLHTLEGDK